MTVVILKTTFSYTYQWTNPNNPNDNTAKYSLPTAMVLPSGKIVRLDVGGNINILTWNKAGGQPYRVRIVHFEKQDSDVSVLVRSGGDDLASPVGNAYFEMEVWAPEGSKFKFVREGDTKQ